MFGFDVFMFLVFDGASLPICLLKLGIVDGEPAASADANRSLAPCEHRTLHEWVSPLMHQDTCSIQHGFENM